MKQVTDYPKTEITVPIYDTRIDASGQGLLTFMFNPTTVQNDGKEIGYVAGGMGVFVIQIIDGPYFQLRHEDLWSAVEKSMEPSDKPPFEFIVYWGTDGIPVVEIRTDKLPENKDGPICRVYMNDHLMYSNPPFEEE